MEKNVSKFEKDFIKSYDEDSDKGYILEVDTEYPKNLLILQSDLPFLSVRMKIKNSISQFTIFMIKKNMLYT